MGCPVLGAGAQSKELTEMLRHFALLLPQCKEQETTLTTCRTRVAHATSITQKLWAFGFGQGHCADEAMSFSKCLAEREAVSAQITAKCSEGGDHRGIAKAYDTCLKSNDNQPTACAHVLQGFLDCARREAHLQRA